MKILNRIVLVTVALFTLSCGIFEPRESAEPETQVPWVSYPINKEQIMDNLIFSYNYPENTNNYEKIFTDDFVFYFSNQDVNEYSTPVSLNKTQENEMLINFHKDMIGSEQSVSLENLSVIDDQDDIINNDSAILYRDYYLTIDGSDPEIYQGRAEFHLILGSDNFWRINIWKDYRSTSNKTWGLLKNEYTL
jgi:hypothetical protein